jgi:integrase
MPREAKGQILIQPSGSGHVFYSLRFRSQGFPRSVIPLGSSREGWNRPRVEHEARLIGAQIRAGTWRPSPDPAVRVEPGGVPTFAELATRHYERKARKGLRPSTLAGLRNKLQAHLLPFFGELAVGQIDERLVEGYIERKRWENDRIGAAAAIGEPLRGPDWRVLRPLKPATINSHLHLLAGILDRAVRDGHLLRNPARGEDLRLTARREHRYGLELDEAWSLIEAAGRLDREPSTDEALRERILELRAQGLEWAEVGDQVGRAPTTCIYHAHRAIPRPVPIRRAIIATLTLAGLRVGELRALTCAQVDLAHRVIRVRDAKTPAGVRDVDIHDDLLDELGAYKHALGERWQPTRPAFPNKRGHQHDRHAIARHVIVPAVARADEVRAEHGLPPITAHVTPHTLRYTYIASMFAAGADQEYVAAQVGHADITTTNRVYRYVLRRRARGEIGERRRQLLRAAPALSWAEGTSDIPGKGI